MKAVTYNAFGDPEVLKISDLPLPEPGAGEIRVKISAAAVNPIDWKIRNGQFECVFEHAFPITPGWDMAGVIDTLGKGVLDWRAGDKVYAYTRFARAEVGTYAEYIVVPESYLAPMPRGFSYVEAASIPLVALTAWQTFIDFAKLTPGQVALIHAGAGGVGSLAIPLAKHLGATVITTAQVDNHGYCRELGADHCIDYQADDYRSVLKGLYPDGVDVILDTLGGETPNESLGVLKPGGALICLNDPPDEDRAKALGLRTLRLYAEPDGKTLAKITRLVEEGVLPIPEIQIFPLSAAQKAHILSEVGHVRGKLVLKVV
ncbi:MAG: NADP-dependent oxidoreductase [Proteobacteria bacterium]|nr:NADP-dependent oxidoreductase [Pseudomonadota bacterium]